ncbi:MAG: PPC domain-containing DNA-binding protein [Acidobacteriota bacterium]
MKVFPSQNAILLVLNRGEKLHAKLQEFAREHELKGAWVQGLGGSGMMTLGYYNLAEREYEWREYSDNLEILSLHGNLAWVDGEPFWHIHGSFGGRDFASIGGHVKEMTVGLTCELLITPLDTPLTRRFDDETGLKLLDKTF